MPITRAKAISLLNRKEMGLYDDSRRNALRQLDTRALTSRIGRARTARDRARDLVQRQKLASRERTGSKRGRSGAANQRSKDKAELLTDILRRFETRLKEVERAARKEEAATRKAAESVSRAARTKKAATKKTAKKATKKAAASNATASSKKAGAGKRTAKSAATTTTGTVKARKKAVARKASRRRLTPQQALERTRELLEAKQERERQARPWEQIGHGNAQAAQAGYQSGAAARRARELHAAESRMPAIMGSISTRDRINQGKRDHGGGGDES